MIQFEYKKIMKSVVLCIYCAIYSCTVFAAPNIEGIQVYQKSINTSAEAKQTLEEDINRYYNAENIWDLLRAEFALPHYEDNPLVQEQIDWFMDHQDFLLRAATRAAPYLYFISQQTRKRHLPAELVLLPMIESAYNPFAYSSAGAAGIWQMMPGTASGFGVKQNWWYDGRRDIVASTKAALNYLVYLGGFFDGNWLLAIAAYDTGEGNVLAAIRKNVRAGKNTDFWSLPVAQETQIYIPRLLALATIIAHPDRYPINFPAVNNAPYLAQVDVGTQMDLKHAAILAGLSLKQLMQLNPGFNHTATGPNGPYKLVLPIENVQQFTENLQQSPFEEIKFKQYKESSKQYAVARNSPTHSQSLKKIKHVEQPIEGHYSLKPGDTLYMVRKGDTLQKIAKHFHVSTKTLLAANQLKHAYSISPGSHLIIPTHIAKDDSTANAIEPGDTLYMVRAGDTLNKIAKKFHTTEPELRITNLLADNTIQEGDQLIIPKLQS